MVRIPSEYQEVEYIESTGKQYIDTNYYVQTESIKIFADFITKTISSERDLIGNQDSRTGRFVAGIYQYKFFGYSKEYQSNETNVTTDAYSSTVDTKYNFEATYNLDSNEKTIVVNGKTYTATHINSIKSTKPVQLFADGASTHMFGCKCYSIALYDGGNLAFNLIPCYNKSSGEIGMYDTVSKHFFTNSGTGTFLKGNDVTYDNINLLESRRRILLNTPHIETVSDNIASFKTDIATKLKECKIHFTPIQEGEGDPSPNNVRPIHGWDGITVTKCGKNLVDVEDMKATYPWSSAQHKSYKVYVGPNRNVTVSIGSSPPQGKSFYFGISGVNENSTAFTWMYHKTVPSYNKTSAKVTTNSKGYVFITLYVPNAEGLNDFYTYFLDNSFQVEFGEEATSYEPYVVPTTLTIPFPQTIYGGYVDLINGEIVEEWNNKLITGETIQNYAENGYNGTQSTNRYLTFVPNSKQSYQSNTALSNYLAPKKVAIWASDNYPNCFTVNGGYQLHVRFANDIVDINATNDTNDTKTNKIKEYLNENPLQLVYPLKSNDIMHYPIDPQTLKALRGMNNIWSDANGNIEVSFYTH